jgi:hypothetical protein
MTPILPLIILCALCVLCGSSRAAEPSTTLLQEHCFRCHGEEGKVKGKVDLLAHTTQDDFLSHPDLLADLVRVIEDHEMPPEDEPPMSDAERDTLLAGLNAPLANLWLTQAQTLGLDLPRFADSTGMIKDLIV